VTARESIAVGQIDQIENTERIRKYAKLAEIDEWISSLPKQYENSLSRDFAGGVVPSLGQFQKVGIARVLFKDPEILILDEPTSNVDPEAEEKIFNQILKVGKEMIVLML
jgi:ATP-binding cassette subfamily B protein